MNAQPTPEQKAMMPMHQAPVESFLKACAEKLDHILNDCRQAKLERKQEEYPEVDRESVQAWMRMT